MEFNRRDYMITLGDEQTIYIDVDSTLVLWETDCSDSEMESRGIRIPYAGRYPRMYCPHRKHVKLLMDAKKSGKIVIVWSSGGATWAEAVVKALHLEEYVDACLTKPDTWVDDLDVSYFMNESNRIYLDDY